MTEAERQLEPAAELLWRAVELDERARVAAREAFLRRAARATDPTRARHYARYAVPLAIAASVLLAIVAWPSRHGLDYRVEGAVSEGGYVRAAPGHAAEITFSDRTRIRALAQARVRIEEVADTGARVSIERGRIEAEVTHSGGSEWRFVAGPFQVKVTGTRFTLTWDADQEQLEVVMLEGAVVVEGYAGSGAVGLRAGQRFVGDAKRRTMLVSDTEAPKGPSAAAPPAADGAPSEPPSPSAGPPASGPGPDSSAAALVTSPKVSWSKRVAKGEFRQVVDEATTRGTRECLATCDPADLSALADAARYVGQTELAEQALQALLARDARASGGRAAFLLGRLSESRGDAARAKSWYERSLSEGRGAFAADALAGKMRTVNTLEGRAAARLIAREYLRLYPKGVHAAAARKLADEGS